jgi:hypothetical protein
LRFRRRRNSRRGRRGAQRQESRRFFAKTCLVKASVRCVTTCRHEQGRFPQIEWEHTHVVRTDDGLKAFCVYESPDEKSVLAHAEALGPPVERYFEVETDLAP